MLAQNFIIRRGLYDQLVTIEPYREIRKVVWYKNGQPVVYAIAPLSRDGITIERTWTIFFKDREDTFLHVFPVVPFQVVVDADTGEIRNWGIKNLREDENNYSYIDIQ